ncbi:Putative cytochrome P450 120 [Acaryochloris thomasi RCC1774]|uniref:Cytochrome P450 120 n=1 Tax=Acaryochloris thomasi RCC1774 TaxID=1764569 RepID=A0A2W1J8U8_9CYAN|nr:cytochrome P450 [Acaryochloris thomasi]PZD70558.1 Putative cytochrome P450 120 [Acaryochloris thomasi RCC1774]
MATGILPLPPGDDGLPIIGDTLRLLFDPNLIANKIKKYGPIFRIKYIGYDAPQVIMIGEEANKFILSNENKYFESYLPSSIRRLFGEDVVAIQSGNIHQSRRKILADAFKPRALRKYTFGITKITNKYLKEWENKKSFRLYDQLDSYTFDVASKLLIGIDSASSTDLKKRFSVWEKGVFSLPIMIPGSSYYKGLNSMKESLALIEKIIKSRMDNGPSNMNDILDILLSSIDESGNPLKIDEVKHQILTILLAGHGTLSSSLSSFCMLLGRDEATKLKCREEIYRLKLNENIDYDSLKSAVYLGQVLKEVLRINPPVGGASRKVVQDCEFSGYRLPKGWYVSYSITASHDNKKVYPNNTQFNPSRFSKSSDKKIDQSYSWIPYGGGVRECLGKEFANLEMKIFAICLLSQYDWKLEQTGNIKMGSIPFLYPKDGLPIKFWKT